MWMVEPGMMCDKHLRGEHVECHMFVGTIRQGKSLAGYVRDGIVDTSLIKERHDQLAAEMVLRGGKHKSPIEQPDCERQGRVDVHESAVELARRCPVCRSKMESAMPGGPTLREIKSLPEGGDGARKLDDDTWQAYYNGDILPGSYYTRQKAIDAMEVIRKKERRERREKSQ
jgi:hypothetical protein